MSDMDRLTGALRNAHQRAQQGDEQAAQHARMLAQEIRRLQTAGQPRERQRGIGLVNEGIARLGDSMAGPANRMVNRGLDAAGIDYRLNEQPFASGMDAAGIARTDDPQGLGERALVGAGEAAGALLPAAGILGAVGRGSGMVANAANTIRSGMATRTGLAAEVAAGAGAQVGDELASRASDGSPMAGAIGQVVGGVAAGAGVGAIPGAVRGVGRAIDASPVAGTAVRAVGSAIAPFTTRGGRIIAEDTFRGATADRFAAADRLADENIGNLTPAQMTGDEGIMGIERARAAADPQFRARLNDRTESSQRTLRNEVSAPAEGRTTRDMTQFFRERMDVHRETVGRYVTQAERRLEREMRNIQPGMSREDASVAAFNAVETAFSRARDIERQKWARVPKKEMIPTTQARQAYQDAVEEATRVSPETIPSKAHRFLGDGGETESMSEIRDLYSRVFGDDPTPDGPYASVGRSSRDEAFGETVSMAELHELYSRLRRAGREAMALTVPDEPTARRSNMIADAILRDIESVEGTSDVARLLADARAFSSEMNTQFGQGNVARMLARTRAGGDRLPPEMALRGTIGQPREAGGVAVDDIRRATGGMADAPMQDFIRDDFSTAVRREDGTVNPADVTRFADSRREAVSRFPDGVAQEIADVKSAARDVVRRRDRADTVLDALKETQRGTVVGVVNAPKGKEVARGIFEADNPAAAARTIARAAQRDPTGDAYLGLKSGVYDEVIQRSGGASFTGSRLMDTLSDPQMVTVLRATLPPGEFARLRQIGAQMRKVERSLSAASVDTENLPNSLISTFVQIQAAKAGRAMGTGTIQVPGMIVGRARQIIARVFNDKADAIIKAALEDQQFLSDLLVGPSASRQRQEQAATRITNWAIGALAADSDE